MPKVSIIVGRPTARLGHCNERVFHLVDADDWLDPDMMAAMCTKALEEEADVEFC